MTTGAVAMSVSSTGTDTGTWCLEQPGELKLVADIGTETGSGSRHPSEGRKTGWREDTIGGSGDGGGSAADNTEIRAGIGCDLQ
ncbi:hypothetical protein ElyMa_000615600 [Elysia marginata]|uniref:Uncharacterized protein n=1 Tax=Elysia marginata TaxID=1093978 RepID=A0AAV4GB82_9GAST|nr:hypothetical protein ElyMa_000615600 [Elysia marginata]